jgi:hypothetical protein
MLFLRGMVYAVADVAALDRTDWPNSNPAASIILPHSSPDSIGDVKLSINPGISFTKIRRIPKKTGMDDPLHPMAIGLDLGTSGVKAVLISADGRLRAESRCVLAVQWPRPLWPEQHPADWIAAVDSAMDALRQQSSDADRTAGGELAIASRMHGAVPPDQEKNLLRPAILWGFGRSRAQCDDWNCANRNCAASPPTARWPDSPHRNCCGSRTTNRGCWIASPQYCRRKTGS